MTVAERIEVGKAARKKSPRSAAGTYSSPRGRQDPVAILAAQETSRIADLLPLRHQRMAENPFAFLRGAAAVMSADINTMPHSSLNVQLCGDAHLSNLGLFAGPDRNLVFDLNDFDETNPGPFEWDVMRLAASFQVAALAAGHKPDFARSLPGIATKAYRKSMRNFAQMNDLDVYYYRIDTTLLSQWAKQAGSKRGMSALRRTEKAAIARDRWSAAKSMTHVVDGRRVFKDRPPLLVSLTADHDARTTINEMYESYRSTLLIDRKELLSRYQWVDAGHKVVGVGSVGLLAFLLLLQGRDENDLLILQIKQAVASVLEPYTGTSTFTSHGQRVVAGQRRIQAATDAFLGWTEGPNRSYYVRQLRDMKWGPDPINMDKNAFMAYAALCGLTLARAHARSGDAVAISAYLGDSNVFDKAIQEFSEAYTHQTHSDFDAYTAAITQDKIPTSGDVTGPVRIRLENSSDGLVTVTSGFGTN
jgi:uncharacterized protein (DUF2252 family)